MTTSRSKLAHTVTLNGPTAREALSNLSVAFTALGLMAHADALEPLRDSTWPLVITITRKRPKRNLEQNALYWAWLAIIGDELGYERDELHFVFRKALIGSETGPLGVEIPASTTTLSVTGFTEYLEGVKRFAANQGIRLPDTIEEWKAWDEA